MYTDVMKAQAFKQVLEAHQFDLVVGGARRDEEKSRTKERFSFHAGDGMPLLIPLIGACKPMACSAFMKS